MKMKMLILLAGVLLTFSAAARDQNKTRLVERQDFEVAALQKPAVIMGRDLWNEILATKYRPDKENPPNQLYFPTAELPDNMRKQMDIPAFREVMIRVSTPLGRSNIRNNPDSSVSLLLPDDELDWIPANLPFVLRTHRFCLCYPDLADVRFLLKHQADPQYYQAWRNNHPNFVAFMGLSEWGNGASMLFSHIERSYAQPPSKGGKNYKGNYLNEEQIAEISKRFDRNPADRREYVNHRLKTFFSDAVRVTHNDASANAAMDGVWNIGHLAAAWGAGMITMEAARVYVNWQYMMMFYRGAARQFNIPWGWYAASHATIRKENGTPTNLGAEPCAWIKENNDRHGPDCGASLNSRERASYMAFLSGANIYMRETAGGNYWDYTAKGEDRWKPAPEGQMYIDFFNFTRRHPDRGTPYAPVALLVPHDRGTSRLPGKAFWRYPYLQSDNMLDAFVTTLFPPQSPAELHRKGIEMTLLNSKYGDIFDALTPDLTPAEPFARVLPAYKVAILIGEYENHAGMIQALIDYVKEGGTLVLNAKQLHLEFSEDFTGIKSAGELTDGEYHLTRLVPVTAQILQKDDAGNPLFTRNKYGKGAVIVAAAHYLTPYYDETNEKTADAVLRETVNGQRKFSHVQWLLDQLLDEVLPAKVTGDIQYGFNRTGNGWWIYLFNNNGILKTALTPQKFDPAAKTIVKIDLQRMPVVSVQELMSGNTFTGSQIELSVEPGKCRILQVTTR